MGPGGPEEPVSRGRGGAQRPRRGGGAQRGARPPPPTAGVSPSRPPGTASRTDHKR